MGRETLKAAAEPKQVEAIFFQGQLVWGLVFF